MHTRHCPGLRRGWEGDEARQVAAVPHTKFRVPGRDSRIAWRGCVCARGEGEEAVCGQAPFQRVLKPGWGGGISKKEKEGKRSSQRDEWREEPAASKTLRPGDTEGVRKDHRP